MPSYTVMIVMDIEFAGGTARGAGGSQSQPGVPHWGAAGYEVQIVSVTSQSPLRNTTICQRALTIARQNVLAAAVKYQWQNQGLRVTTVSCTVI